MGKQIKKKKTQNQKKNKYMKTCERCGNEVFSFKKVFKCKFCGWLNGLNLQEEVQITRGGIDDR